MSTAASAALACAIRLAGPSATLDVVRPLLGGSHATTYLVRTTDPQREMILREFPAGDPAAVDEERALTALDTLGGLAPRLLARSTVDDGEPSWVLISRLPGKADIVPDRPHTWAAQLGHVLARIHSADAAVTADLDTVFDRRGHRTRLFGPAAPVVDKLWDDKVITAPMVLTHGDYQSGNVVWDNGVLTGVIDWEGASRGPAGYDIGWCRFDVYLLCGEHVADVFLAAYEEAGGARVHDLQLWDLWTLARAHQSVGAGSRTTTTSDAPISQRPNSADATPHGHENSFGDTGLFDALLGRPTGPQHAGPADPSGSAGGDGRPAVAAVRAESV